MTLKNPITSLCTGVILAGGLNIRFNRENKALAVLGKEKIIENTLRLFRGFFNEVILVTNNPLLFASWDVSIVTDIYPVRSPLTGIFSGLFYATAPHIFVVACDIPFLQPGVVQVILDSIDADADIFIPATEKGLEPLCAAYSKKCLVPIERLLLTQMETDTIWETTGERALKKGLKIQKFFNKVRVKTISELQLRANDPDLVSFFNVNTPKDLVKAMEILSFITKEPS